MWVHLADQCHPTISCRRRRGDIMWKSVHVVGAYLGIVSQGEVEPRLVRQRTTSRSRIILWKNGEVGILLSPWVIPRTSSTILDLSSKIRFMIETVSLSCFRRPTLRRAKASHEIPAVAKSRSIQDKEKRGSHDAMSRIVQTSIFLLFSLF